METWECSNKDCNWSTEQPAGAKEVWCPLCAKTTKKGSQCTKQSS